MKKLVVAAALLFAAISFSPAFAQIGQYAQPQVLRQTPGYATGRFYPAGNGNIAGNIAVPILDTVIYLYPFVIFDEPMTVTSLNTRVITGVASCTVKMVLFAHDYQTKRPTGTAIAGSNTPQNCASSATNQQVTVSEKLYPGVIYWAGVAVSTGASQFWSMSSGAAGGASTWGQIGGATLATANITSVTAPYTYATDITTLNLSGATFSDQGNGGNPVIFLGN